MNALTLKTQELPFDHPDSTNMFQPTPEKPFVAVPATLELYQHEAIHRMHYSADQLLSSC